MAEPATEVDGKKELFDLLKSGIFANITQEEADRLYSQTKWYHFRSQEGIKDLNSNVFVLEEGEIELYTRGNSDEECHPFRNAGPGEAIYSVFDILDAIVGSNSNQERRIYAKATKGTTVLCLPIASFLVLARENPTFTVRLMQVTLIHTMHIRGILFGLSVGSKIWKKKNTTPIPDEIIFSQAEAESEKIGLSRSLSPLYLGNMIESLFSFAPMFNLLNWKRENTDIQDLPILYKNLMAGSQTGTQTAEEIDDLKRKEEICDQFMRELQLEEFYRPYLLKCVKVLKLPNGTRLFTKYQENMDLVYLYQGKVTVHPHQPQKEHEAVDEFEAPAILGIYSALTGEPQRYAAEAGNGGCTVALFSQRSIFEMIKLKREIMIRLCYYKINQLSLYVRMLDLATNWKGYESGDTVNSEGHTPSILYIVMGRLRRSSTSQNGEDNPFDSRKREFGQGRLIGIEDILVQENLKKDYFALRNSVIARIPLDMCRVMMKKFPESIFEKIQEVLSDDFGGDQSTAPNVSTVTFVSISEEVPPDFQTMVSDALNALNHGVHSRIISKDDINIPGITADPPDSRSPTDWQIQSYLNFTENTDIINLYKASSVDDKWNELVIKQADLVFVVGMFKEKDNKVTEIEKLLAKSDKAKTAKKILLLLHEPNDNGEYENPSGTFTTWIEKREKWCTTHLHIRCPTKVKQGDANPQVLSPDFPRLARYITGRSSGLVLGGGGARGLAHIGIIRSMLENNKPIDMVGGTSMGAFVGASFCRSTDLDELETKMKEFCSGMDSCELYLDATLPYLAVSTGHYFNKLVRRTFGTNTRFADLWLPYFNIATDVTSSQRRVNTKGTLWRFVRSSMSLAALVPPMINPEDDHYLFDGGFVDNLPAPEMRLWGAKKIYAVDVGGRSDLAFINYGDDVSGWWLLWQKINPCRNRETRVPNLLTVITRLTCVTGADELKRVMKSRVFTYIRPDINEFGTLEFKKYDEIVGRGYEKGQQVFGPRPSPAEEPEAEMMLDEDGYDPAARLVNEP